MDVLNNFFHTFIFYFQELWWILAIGFFLSGIFYEFIPSKHVERFLGDPGFKPIFISSIVGIILPVCCIGSLPIALTLKKKGARLGPVLAFLVATPATSISALFVCWKLLGSVFTIYIFCSVALLGIIMGVITNLISVDGSNLAQEKACCHNHEQDAQENRFLKALKYAFITLPKDMGREVLIGMAIASFISVYPPIQNFIQEYLTGVIGYVSVLGVGLLTYVCSTASVPLADAFLQSGMSYGQALLYLLVGPITSYGTILVIKKDFGGKVLAVYLGIICIMAIIYGIIFDIFVSQLI